MAVLKSTAFGKVLRKLRIDANEVLGDMADKLGITAAYLSSIETGKREIPSDFIEKLAKLYNLSESTVQDLQKAKAETQKKVILQFPEEGNTEDDVIETALMFARDISKLNKKQLQQVRKILAQTGE